MDLTSSISLSFVRVYTLENTQTASLGQACNRTLTASLVRLVSPAPGEFRCEYRIEAPDGFTMERHANGADELQAMVLAFEMLHVHLMKYCAEHSLRLHWRGKSASGLVHAQEGEPAALRAPSGYPAAGFVPAVRMDPPCLREFVVHERATRRTSTSTVQLLECGQVVGPFSASQPLCYVAHQLEWPSQETAHSRSFGYDALDALRNTFEDLTGLAHRLGPQSNTYAEFAGTPGLGLRIRDLWRG